MKPSIRQAWKELHSAHYERLSTPPHLTPPSCIWFQRWQIINLEELLEVILKFRFLSLLPALPLGCLFHTPMWVANSCLAWPKCEASFVWFGFETGSRHTTQVGLKLKSSPASAFYKLEGQACHNQPGSTSYSYGSLSTKL